MRFFIIIFYALWVSLSAFSESLTFKLGGQDYIVSLSDQTFEHITLGRQTQDGFSGGHSWTPYFEAHVKGNEDANVFFDANLGAYIVGSKKGDSLVTIIEKLRSGRKPRYHSLFSTNIITKQFILDSFKKAIILSALKNEKHFDGNLFYVEHNDLKVAGYFEQNGNEYTIQTFFPDLCWYMRAALSPKDAHFNLSRFLKYVVDPTDATKGAWVAHGITYAQLNSQTSSLSKKGGPSNVIALSTVAADREIAPSTFLAYERYDDFFRSTYFKNGATCEFIDDLFSLIISDFNNPTKEEFDYIYNVTKTSLDFNVTFKKNDTLRKKIFTLKVAIQKTLQQDNPFKTMLSFEKGVIKLNNGFLDDSLSFCHIVLHNILVLHTASHVIEGDGAIGWDWRPKTNCFYNNFIDKLFEGNDELKLLLKQDNFIFKMEIATQQIRGQDIRNFFSLVLYYFDHPGDLSLRTDELVHHTVFILATPNKVWDLKFQDILPYTSNP